MTYRQVQLKQVSEATWSRALSIIILAQLDMHLSSVTRVTAASQECGRKRTRFSARRTSLAVKILWSQLYISDNFAVFSRPSLSTFRAVKTRRSAPTVGCCAAAEHAVAFVRSVSVQGRYRLTVTCSAHPSFCKRVPRLCHRSKTAGAWCWAPIPI